MSVNIVEVVDPQAAAAAATTDNKKTAIGEDEGVKGEGGRGMYGKRRGQMRSRARLPRMSRARARSHRAVDPDDPPLRIPCARSSSLRAPSLLYPHIRAESRH